MTQRKQEPQISQMTQIYKKRKEADMAKTAAIVSTCQIKDIKIKQDGTELRFDDLQLTSNQIKQVSEIIKEKETVEISLTPVQGKLPLDEEKE